MDWEYGVRYEFDNYSFQRFRCRTSLLKGYKIKGIKMVTNALWSSEARKVVPWSETLYEP